jgi:hypothetical protein
MPPCLQNLVTEQFPRGSYAPPSGFHGRQGPFGVISGRSQATSICSYKMPDFPHEVPAALRGTDNSQLRFWGKPNRSSCLVLRLKICSKMKLEIGTEQLPVPFKYSVGLTRISAWSLKQENLAMPN